MSALCFLKPERWQASRQGSLDPSLLSLRREKKISKLRGQSFSCFLWKLSAENVLVLLKLWENAVVSRPVSRLCEELWRLWPACFWLISVLYMSNVILQIFLAAFQMLLTFTSDWHLNSGRMQPLVRSKRLLKPCKFTLFSQRRK